MTISRLYFFDHFINHSLIQVVPITILLFIHVNSIWHLIMLYGLFDLKDLDLHCSLLNSELFQFLRFTLHTLIDHFYFHICLFTLYLIRSIQLIFQPLISMLICMDLTQCTWTLEMWVVSLLHTLLCILPGNFSDVQSYWRCFRFLLLCRAYSSECC